MNIRTMLQGTTALSLTLAATLAFAAPVPINTTDAANGISDLFSATFDPSQTPCTGGSPSYCAFFGGDPPTSRSIVVTPTPTGATNAVPLGITPVPASGSFLDLSISGNQLTLAGGTIAFPGIVLTIETASTAGNPTIVNANGAGVVFETTSRVATLNADGQAEFLVNPSAGTIVDFSAFTTVAFAPVGSCAGPLCALIPVLTLDMIRYQLFIDYDPTFTYFTASFIGQTANNSLLSITMNSNAPESVVTDSRAPADDLSVPFGSVSELTTATQTVTVTNSGNASLLLGTVAGANPLAAPFTLINDNCTGATVLAAATCTFSVRFSPTSTGAFSDSLNIPSNDADEPSTTVAVSGTGTATAVPNIAVADSVAPTTDGLIPFGTAAIGAQVDQVVTVTNDGSANLDIGDVAVANSLAAPYSIVNDTCSGQSVIPAASCTIGVRFEPTAAGATSDSFNIPSNDIADPTITISVTGTGAAVATPSIAVTDNTLPANDQLVPFGNVTEGTTRDRIITVTNNGTADLVLGTVAGSNSLAAPFNVADDNCSSLTLAPAANCTVIVRYSAAVAGVPSSDSLDIPSNDPDQATVTVDLTGTAIAAGEGGVDTPRAEGADGGFMAIDPATLLLFGAAGAFGLRRRRLR